MARPKRLNGGRVKPFALYVSEVLHSLRVLRESVRQLWEYGIIPSELNHVTPTQAARYMDHEQDLLLSYALEAVDSHWDAMSGRSTACCRCYRAEQEPSADELARRVHLMILAEKGMPAAGATRRAAAE